jgi:hypothetical protein
LVWEYNVVENIKTNNIPRTILDVELSMANPLLLIVDLFFVSALTTTKYMNFTNENY